VQLLFKPGGKETPRKRVLSREELHIFLGDPKACTRYERLGRVITVLLLTGQRRSELTKALWGHIDFKARTWFIPKENSKNELENVVPLSPWAVEELRALQREAEGSRWVLPGKDPSSHLESKLLTRGVAKCLKRFKTQGIEAPSPSMICGAPVVPACLGSRLNRTSRSAS
jgi:integrase